MPLTKVSSGVIAANAVVDSFGTQSITGDKIGLGAITGNTLASNIINANNIVNASITGAKIALGTITGDDIATNQITGNLLTANCVSGNNIVANTITANLFSTTIYASNNDIMGISANANTFGNTIIIVAGNTSSISVGDIVAGANVFPGTTVLSFNSPPSNRSNITVSKALAGSNTNTAVQFYSSTKVISPGIAGPGLCKAWVNFDGTGSVPLRASFNVNSITDNGTGSYTVNFTNAMPDVNYAVAGGAGTNSVGNGYRWLAVGSSQSSDFSMTTTSVRVQTTYDGTNKTDAEFVSVAIFR